MRGIVINGPIHINTAKVRIREAYLPNGLYVEELLSFLIIAKTASRAKPISAIK